jgi:hypothetical protein
MSTTSIPEGPGSVSGAPNLPEGFADTFTSRFIDAGDVHLHAVIGGEGPPLLLIHGWPGSWYYWRTRTRGLLAPVLNAAAGSSPVAWCGEMGLATANRSTEPQEPNQSRFWPKPR